MAYNNDYKKRDNYNKQWDNKTVNVDSKTVPKPSAPYNFIPFSNNILLAENNEKVFHNQVGDNLKSGEIHLSIEAKTPIIVSEGNKDEPYKKHFFKGANGKYMIPGSTIAGLTRFNMNILGYGYLHIGENFEDYQIYFRAIAEAKEGNRGKLKEYYDELVVKEKDKAEKVNAGYLVKNGNGYCIYKVNEVLRVRKSKLPSKFEKWQDIYADTVECKYIKGTGNSDVSIFYKNEEVKGAKDGIAMFPGKPVKGKTKKNKNNNGKKPVEEKGTMYIFPKIDYSSEQIKLSENDIKSYKIDYETRRNVLGKNKKFWELPNNYTIKPIFYIQHDGHTYFGMTKLLRIGYKNNLIKGLKPKHIECNEGSKLDYVHNILGYSNKDKAFKSRVSFGDCQVCGNAEEVKEPIKVVLSGAKPSYFINYLYDGKNYNNDDFSLRGYKQYWMKENEKPNNIEVSDKVSSLLYPLPENTRFEGVIRFKNLTETELGLLLYSLKLENGCYQTIGMAKPYGYGRTEFKIDKLLEYNNTISLCVDDFTKKPYEEKDINYVNDLISSYKKFIHNRLAISMDEDPIIEDFMLMRKSIIDNEIVEYNELNEYLAISNNDGKLKLGRVKDIIKENEEINKGKINVTEENMGDMLKQLQNMHRKDNRR